MAARNTFFKKEYTEEEINECIQWFEQRRGKLPADFNINEGMKSYDLQKTVDRLIQFVKGRFPATSITFNGYAANLLYLRDLLQKQNPDI